MDIADYSAGRQGYYAVPNEGYRSIGIQRKPVPVTIESGYYAQLLGSDVDDAKSPRHVTTVPTHRVRKSRGWSKPIVLIADLLSILLPCCFIALGIEAARLNDTPMSHRGNIVEQASHLGPTIFPIAFAIIVGRLMRSLALWKAERGAGIGLIEQLNGSQNLAAAFERAFQLRNLSIFSLLVVLLWGLSPIGGQSSLRIVQRRHAANIRNTTVFYFDTAGEDTCCSVYTGVAGVQASSVLLSGIVDGVLISLKRMNGSDIWGNIKIPFLDRTTTYTSSESTNGWYEFSESEDPGLYSSLLGNVVSGLTAEAESEFLLPSSYLNMTCTGPKFFNFKFEGNPDGSTDYGGFLEWAGISNSSIFGPPDGMKSYFLASSFQGTPQIGDPNDFHIIYAATSYVNGDDGQEWATYDCVLGRVLVESNIFCLGNECHVKRMRWYASPVTGWPFPNSDPTIPSGMLYFLSTMTQSKNSGMISPVDWFVRGSNAPFTTSIASPEDALDYHNIDSHQVAGRLGSLVNTAWQAGILQEALIKPPSDNTTALTLSTNASTVYASAGGVDYSTGQTPAQVTTYTDLYKANMQWIIATIVISTTVLFCGIANLYFSYACKLPDILGYVSSMTRGVPEFENVVRPADREELDQMDGLRRARLMANVHMQISRDNHGLLRLRNIDSRRKS